MAKGSNLIRRKSSLLTAEMVCKALAGGLLACGLVAEAVGVSGGINGAAFASGYVPGLQPRTMGGSIVARSVGAASTSSATARGLVVGLRAQHQNGDTSRREALSLAIAAGVSFFGSASAHAAGSTGPEGVDGPSAKKMAITNTAPGLDRNKIKVHTPPRTTKDRCRALSLASHSSHWPHGAEECS